MIFPICTLKFGGKAFVRSKIIFQLKLAIKYLIFVGSKIERMKDENINPFTTLYWRRWLQSDTVSSSSTILFPPNLCLFRNDGCFAGLPSSTSLNPGNIANLHKNTRDMMPEWIEGLNVRCATNLDINKTLCMEWLMGNSVPAGFRFGGMICQKDNENVTVRLFYKFFHIKNLTHEKCFPLQANAGDSG